MNRPNTRLVRPAGRPGEASRADLAALKAAVRDTLRLTAAHAVVIQQLACTEPGCPPVETVIAVLSAGAPGRRWTVHKPLAELTPQTIRDTLQRPEPDTHQGEDDA